MYYIVFALVIVFMCGAAAVAGEADSAPAHTNRSEASLQADGSERWSYAAWDTDGDARLSEGEFFTGYEESGLFEQWDVNDDGVLDAQELGIGLYDTWDYDDDGYLVDDEIEEHGFWDW